VPSGAAAVKFRNLEATDKIPLGGWQVVEKNQNSKRDLYLVTQEEKQSGRTGA
jgi:hypothetical protein